MTVSLAQFIAPVQLKAGLQTLYTCPASTTARVDQFTISNPSASSASVTVYVVPKGGTAGAATTLLPATSVAAGAEQPFNDIKNGVLTAGDSIQSLCSTASAIVIMASGITEA